MVVAWHTDRLHRSPRELEGWIEACEARGVATVTVRAGELDLASASGRMIARMLGAAARHESEQKSERMRRARAQAASSGRPNGPLGYGYALDVRSGCWQLVPEQAAVIREGAVRVLAGESLRAVAADLTRRGIPTPGGSPTGWRGPNLGPMLTAARYCGWREYTPATTRGGRGRGRGRGELVAPGDWPAILTRETTEALRALLGEPARRRGGGPAAHLLTGIARCGLCGAALASNLDTLADRRRYACTARARDGRRHGLTVSGPGADAHVTAAVLAALGDAVLPPAGIETTLPDTTLAGLNRDRARLDELAADHAAGRITRREWLCAREVITRRLEAMSTALYRGDTAPSPRRGVLPAGGPARAWLGMGLERRRGVLVALIERVVVHLAPRPTRTFDPARLEIVWRA